MTEFLADLSRVILNPIIGLLFAIAFLVFLIGIFKFISSASDGAERDTGKKRIVYGLIGMLIMFSAYGLIRLTLNTFGIQEPDVISGN
jgi:hypothetical protein